MNNLDDRIFGFRIDNAYICKSLIISILHFQVKEYFFNS